MMAKHIAENFERFGHTITHQLFGGAALFPKSSKAEV